MNHQYLLSICMMVKDEEKNLKKCLDGLVPLLNRNNVELIIVDTGSTDKTIEIASEYTSKIYHHPWNNHFSEMRNITISYAKGEFILIIDADEIMLDADELYNILSDTNLKKFSALILKIKNYTGTSGFYTVLPQERVFKNDGYFRYDGAVHNQPVYKEPIYSANVYIDHFGYKYEDEGLREKKFIRTGGILRNLIEKEPDNPYYRFQMAKSYIAHKDEKEAMEEIRVAYRLITGKKDLVRQHIYICGTHAIFSCTSREYDEAVLICKEGLLSRPDYLDLYYIMGESLNRLNKKEKAFEAYEKYIDLSLRYNELSIASDRGMEICYIGEAYQNNALNYIVNELFASARYEEALTFAYLIKDLQIRSVWLLKVLIMQKKFAEAGEIFHTNISGNDKRDLFSCAIEELKTYMSNEDKKELEEQLSFGSDLYSLLNRVRITHGEEKRNLVNQALKSEELDELPDFYADLFMEIDEYSRPIFSAFKRISKSKIKSYLKNLLDNKESLANFLEEYLLKENVRNDDFHSLRVYIGIAYSLLIHEAIHIRDSRSDVSDRYYSIFKMYMEKGFKYINHLYNFERMRLFYNTIEDQEDKFFIALFYANETIGRADYKTGVKYFLEAARSNPYLACYMQKYKEELFPGRTSDDREDIFNG